MINSAAVAFSNAILNGKLRLELSDEENKAVGIRLRLALKEVKSISQQIRVEVRKKKKWK